MMARAEQMRSISVAGGATSITSDTVRDFSHKISDCENVHSLEKSTVDGLVPVALKVAVEKVSSTEVLALEGHVTVTRFRAAVAAATALEALNHMAYVTSNTSDC
jgi:hypothetical protein